MSEEEKNERLMDRLSNAKVSRRTLFKLGAAGAVAAMVPWALPEGVARASVLVPTQVPIMGRAVTKYVTPLPRFGPGGAAARVDGSGPVTVSMHEIQHKILPDAFYAALPAPFSAGAWVWAYNVGGVGAIYPGVSIEAQKGTQTDVTYINNLPIADSTVQKYITVDQTLHWADPLMQHHMMPMTPYEGPPPAVAHLHGGEVRSDFDGGPDQWYTPDGIQGPGYRSAAGAPGPNATVFQYPNQQEAATLWFHDHCLGATRLNVYAGMAAFYLLRDQYDTGLASNFLGLPAEQYEVELAIQDRQFDSNGQLVFPDSVTLGMMGLPPNPMMHPNWIPEFFGDVMVVNGRSWPSFNVEPRRYRFRLLDGCNSRFLQMRLMNKITGTVGPPTWQIGTDGGLLDTPVMIKKDLLMGPGERADVIIDFTNFAGQTLTLTNSAKGPFPNGMTVDPQTTGQIMQFVVGATASSPDTTFNPALGNSLRVAPPPEPATPTNPPPIERLVTAATGALGAGVTLAATRLMTLNEVMGMGGPKEAIVNNSKWNGKRADAAQTPIPGSVADLQGNWLTELPENGSTEVWEIVNLTADAHPIHLHLVQFQILNRQPFDVGKYQALYDSLFPGGTFDGLNMAAGTWEPITYAAGVYIPGYGPPLAYGGTDTLSAGKLGGNPDVTPFLKKNKTAPPLPNEAGWKDTAVMYPGEVTRIVVRFTPQDVAVGSETPGTNQYSFDPTTGPGYVWHCHIVDHEDNEMMRPYHPV